MFAWVIPRLALSAHISLPQTILREITSQEWERLRKYGSWMRELKFLEDEDEISQDAFDILLRSPHSKLLCSRLLKLSWIADPVFGGDFIPFLSPQLRDVRLASRPGTLFPFPHAISALPVSSLESLRLSIVGDELVKEAIISIFRDCGKSLMTLEVSRMDQLRDGSWCRIMLLPRLRHLETDQSPPTTFPPCLPIFFPSLRQVTLRGPSASEWIPFLAKASMQKVPSDTGTQPRRAAPYLLRLHCDHTVELDVLFISHFRVFQNLSMLFLGNGCSRATTCKFHLTDEDISRLAMELPRLRDLSLGAPCSRNTCSTTIISLLALSTHCKGLRMLCIHFNTRRLARDVWDSLHHPLRHNSHPPSRCPLTVLDVGLIPLTVEALGEDVFTSLAGLVDIFPGLERIRYYTFSSHASWGWRQFTLQIPNFQEMRKSLPAVFVQEPCGNH